MSKDNKPASAASIKAKLANLADKLERDHNGLALEFAIERLVARLGSDSKLAQHLVFKGGFVMLKAYGSNRTTVDLDTSVHGLSIEEAEQRVRKVIDGNWSDGLWIGAIESQVMDHQTEYTGLRLTMRYSFGEPKVDIHRLGKLILDIGIADAVTPGPQDASLEPLLGGDPISWRIYPVETIVAEKLHALVTHGNLNSRFKDIYDLTVLLPKTRAKPLKTAVARTFEHRSTPVPKSFAAFWKGLDKGNLRRSQGAVALVSGDIADFDELAAELEALLNAIDGQPA